MMRKLGTALTSGIIILSMVTPALAETATTGTTTRPIKGKRVADVACVQAAIEKRDTTLISAVTTSASSVTTALTTRKDALKAAWSLTDIKARREALKAARTTYATTVRAARKTLQSSRMSTWKTFRTDAKACGAQGDEVDSEGMDAGI